MKNNNLVFLIFSIVLFSVCNVMLADYPSSSTSALTVDLDMNGKDLFNIGEVSTNDIVTTGPWVDARAYTSLSSAITAASGKTLLISDAQTVSSNTTIGSTVHVVVIRGGSFSVSSGATLTINSPFQAGTYQVFSGDGTVKFGSGTTPKIYPQWWGAKADGVNNDTDAIKSAIASVPSSVSNWGSQAARYYNSSVISFPSTSNFYSIDEKIDVTSTKSILFRSESPIGARIKQTNTELTAIFLVKASTRFVGFKNLAFHKGGVELEGQCRERTMFSSCSFEQTPDYAIKTLGQSVVGVDVFWCLFSSCAGGIKIADPNCDLWTIRKCAFWRNTACDISINSTGVRVNDCDFEIRETTSINQPCINIRFGNNSITNCRFGNEYTGGYGPARDIIVVGEIDTPSAGTIMDISILNNSFMGMVTPTASMAKHAIVFNKGPVRVRIANNDFRKHYGALLMLNYTGACLNSYFMGNTIDQFQTAGTFGGTGTNNFSVY